MKKIFKSEEMKLMLSTLIFMRILLFMIWRRKMNR